MNNIPEYFPMELKKIIDGEKNNGNEIKNIEENSIETFVWLKHPFCKDYEIKTIRTGEDNKEYKAYIIPEKRCGVGAPLSQFKILYVQSDF